MRRQRTRFASLILVIGWTFAGGWTEVLGADAARPNVILVITDDQGYGDLGCHGNPIIQTPNIDRLHSQCVRLTNFHVDPTCAPTRSALMTGRYSTKTGVWHTVMGRSILAADEVTIADVFKANGYVTGIFGKWHLGDNYPFRPQDRGFDEVVVHGGGGVNQTPDYWGNDYFDDTYFHNGKPQQYTGYCTDVFFDKALSFMESNKERPFFLYLPTNAPHGPFFVEEKYSKPYTEKGVPNPRDKFWGMITNIDENVGRLMERMQQLGLADNTILIFMTDNGTAMGYREMRGNVSGYNAGMRGTKGSEYEGGHRVPCFWHWPSVLGKPRDIASLTAHIDMLPTLIELCRLEFPSGVQMDGTSLAGALKGQASIPERTLFVHSQRIEHPEKWRKSAVMTQQWRLVNGEELYDIQADPGQKHDVAKDHPQVVQSLRQQYEQWWKDISGRFDEYVRPVLGADEVSVVELNAHDWHTPQEEIPWHQGLIADPNFFGNGVWTVTVARDGRYEFVLRQRPRVAQFPIQANVARISIGNQTAEKSIPEEATHVSFELPLKAGDYDLKTWFDTTDGKQRGAYFVEVRKTQ